MVTNNPEEKRYDAIYDKLNDMWPKASKEELGRATTNILQITSQFKIDEKTRFANQTPLYFSMSVSDVLGTIYADSMLYFNRKSSRPAA